MDVSKISVHSSIIMDNTKKRIKFLHELVMTDIENDIPDEYIMVLIEIVNYVAVGAYVIKMPPASLKFRCYPYIPN